MSWSLRRILTFGLGLAIAVLALNSLVTFWNIQNFIGSDQWVLHTREVLNELDELLASVQDADLARHGHLFSGDGSGLKSKVDRLRTMTADNPGQQDRALRLERQVEDQVGLLREFAASRRERGLEGAMGSMARGGYEVEIAVDGREGARKAVEGDYDLVLMDMSLPEIDGWEATRQLRADPRTQALPIVALTAYAMAGDREKAIEAGCDDYDSKPVEFARLLEKIETQFHARAMP